MNLAQKLTSDDEAEIRTAISRAYYVAFLVSRDRFNVKQESPLVHQDVISELYRLKLKKAANKLRILRRLRNSADYDVKSTIVAAQANRAIYRSQDIIHQVSSFNV